jgi:hypothetical protein
MNLILKLITAPLVFCIFLIMGIARSFRGAFFFIRYGGEWVTYMEDDKESIANIYYHLKETSKKP